MANSQLDAEARVRRSVNRLRRFCIELGMPRGVAHTASVSQLWQYRTAQLRELMEKPPCRR